MDGSLGRGSDSPHLHSQKVDILVKVTKVPTFLFLSLKILIISNNSVDNVENIWLNVV